MLTDEEKQRRLRFVRHLMTEVVPFNRVLGIDVVDVQQGKATFAVPFRPELVGDPDRPALQWALFALLDAADRVNAARTLRFDEAEMEFVQRA